MWCPVRRPAGRGPGAAVSRSRRARARTAGLRCVAGVPGVRRPAGALAARGAGSAVGAPRLSLCGSRAAPEAPGASTELPERRAAGTGQRGALAGPGPPGSSAQAGVRSQRANSRKSDHPRAGLLSVC